MNEPVRLNKYLAHQLGISRREADDFISSGRVKLNDTHATLGSRMNPGDTLTVDDRPIESKDKFDYYLLHKPTGYVCSRRRQGDTPTIYELFPESLSHLKPVGRLDKDSSGILVMTDDGDFAHQMTHPKFQKTKVYEVTLDHPLEPLHQQMISDYGVTLEDGVSKFIVSKSTPAAGGSARGSAQNSLPEANILGADAETGPVDSEAHQPGQSPGEASEEVYTVTMSEGRNRQIRRTFSALGYEVTTLHRTRFGAYSIGDLASGAYLAFEK